IHNNKAWGGPSGPPAPAVTPAPAACSLHRPASDRQLSSNRNRSPSSPRTDTTTNHQPPATNHGELGSPSAPPLRRAYLPLVHAEVMRHLVPHRVFHHLLQMRFSVRQPFMRTLEYRDPVRHCEALEDAAGGAGGGRVVRAARSSASSMAPRGGASS